MFFCGHCRLVLCSGVLPSEGRKDVFNMMQRYFVSRYVSLFYGGASDYLHEFNVARFPFSLNYILPALLMKILILRP